MSESETPMLVEVLEAAMSGVLAGVRVSLPGRIESYDKGTRRATVQILIPDGHVDGTGERQTTTIAPLTDVPVMGCGSGTTRVKFPIRSGDPCWIMFSSSCIAKLKALGGTDVIDPEDDRHHHEADAVVMPIPSLDATGADDDTMIEFTDDGLIRAGGDNRLVTKADFDNHAHPAPGGATGVPTTPAVGTRMLRG